MAIVGLTEGVVLQIRSEKLAEDTTRAAIVAQNILEEIRYNGSFGAEKEDGELSGDDAGLRWEYEMSEAGQPGLFRIVLAISWSDGLARKEYRTETLMSER